MDKAFFESLTERARRFGERAGLTEDVRVEVCLTNGRTYVLDQVVEATDSYLHFDGTDPAAEDERVSLVLPYYQVGHVKVGRARPRAARGTGFGLRAN